MSKKRFFIYNSWQPTIELLTTEEKAEMLINFFRYQNNQPLVLNTSGLKIAWASFQYLLDKDSTNYSAKKDIMATNRAKRVVSTTDSDVNINEINASTTTSINDLNASTNALSDNVNVNVKVNDNDNVNGNGDADVDITKVKQWIRSHNLPPSSSIIQQFPHIKLSECSDLVKEVVNETFNF